MIRDGIALVYHCTLGSTCHVTYHVTCHVTWIWNQPQHTLSFWTLALIKITLWLWQSRHNGKLLVYTLWNVSRTGNAVISQSENRGLARVSMFWTAHTFLDAWNWCVLYSCIRLYCVLYTIFGSCCSHVIVFSINIIILYSIHFGAINKFFLTFFIYFVIE